MLAQDAVDLDVEKRDQVRDVLLVLGDVADEIDLHLEAEQVLELPDFVVELDQEMVDRPVLGVDVDEVLLAQLGEVEGRRQGLEDGQGFRR